MHDAWVYFTGIAVALMLEPGVAAVVLLAVLLVGVAAGRAKRRLTLLVAGLVALLASGIAVVVILMRPGADPVAMLLIVLYAVVLQPAVAFLAGWLCARGSWFKRLVVIGVAAVLLAVLPFAATAPALFPGG